MRNGPYCDNVKVACRQMSCTTPWNVPIGSSTRTVSLYARSVEIQSRSRQGLTLAPFFEQPEMCANNGLWRGAKSLYTGVVRGADGGWPATVRVLLAAIMF
jgi:hypothetical protein